MAQDPLKFLRDRQGPARAPLITEPGGPGRGQQASPPQRPSPAGNRPIPPSRQAELQAQAEAEAKQPEQPREEPQQMEAPVQPARAPEPEPKAEGTGRLIVGPAIKVKGEIGACDTLVVQGEVEASMSGRVMEVASGGLFKGKVELEEASVSGKVEGTLTVSGLLTVARGGEVRGKIRYGELQIESGGVIAGDVGLLGDDPQEDKLAKSTKSNGASKSEKDEKEDSEEKAGA